MVLREHPAESTSFGTCTEISEGSGRWSFKRLRSNCLVGCKGDNPSPSSVLPCDRIQQTQPFCLDHLSHSFVLCVHIQNVHQWDCRISLAVQKLLRHALKTHLGMKKALTNPMSHSNGNTSCTMIPFFGYVCTDVPSKMNGAHDGLVEGCEKCSTVIPNTGKHIAQTSHKDPTKHAGSLSLPPFRQLFPQHANCTTRETADSARRENTSKIAELDLTASPFEHDIHQHAACNL